MCDWTTRRINLSGQCSVLLLYWKLPACGNRSLVSTINSDRGLFTTFYRLESNPSVHEVMSGKQSSLQGAGSETKQFSLQGSGSETKQSSLQGGGSETKQSSLQGGGSETKQSSLWGGGSQTKQSSLQGDRSETNTEVNNPAFRVVDHKQTHR